MAGIQASGAGSGLDVSSLITQLVAAERAPLDARISRVQSAATTEISALAALKGSMSTLYDSLAGINSTSSFNARTAASSDSAIFTAAATSAVEPGDYGIEVLRLASAQKLASGPFVGGRDAVVGTGTLTISYGESSFAVAIDSDHDTLTQIRDAINAAIGNEGVSASILNDVTGSRLILTARATGAATAMTVTQSGGDGGLSQLAYDGFGPGVDALTETSAALDAWVKVNGYDHYSASNTVTGAIDGLTLALKKADLGTEHTLTVSNDTATATSRIKKFVADYNAIARLLGQLQAYDPATRKGGPLLGDAYARGVQDQLRRDLSTAVAGTQGVYTSLAALGIKTDATGQLTVDDAKLQTALTADFNGVANLFVGTDGVATRMYSRLDAELKSDAQLAQRNASLAEKVKDLATDREKVDLRMQGIEARYRKQFTTLDTLLSQMQSTGNFLTQQISNWSK